MAVSPCGGAEVYRWEDEQGRVHFGDRPPFGEEAEAMAIPLTPSAAVPANIPTEEERRERRRKLLDLYREEREVKRRERDERARRKAEKHNQCARISGQLARYRNAAGIYQRLPDGERRYLSRTEREAEIARLQEAADYWCDE